MKKMKLHTPNLAETNIDRIREIFPNCVTEAHDEKGQLRLAVDFDMLRQELSDHIVEGPERYHLDWPGKRQARLMANAPIAKTLRPCREESVDFDTTENLFIEGDNLNALKLLRETYLGKIKMIYIDPPYNTGKDFVYKDKFAGSAEEYLLESNQKDEDGNHLVDNLESNGRFHSKWLSMMYPRLKLAQNLLKDDGVIAVHIDEHEYPNLEKLLSEIFGKNNNLGTIIWDKRNPKGDASGIAYQHESISFYSKDRETFKNKCELKRPKENASIMMEKVEQLIKEEGGLTENVKLRYKNWLKKQKFSGGEKAYNLIDNNKQIFQSVSMAWPNKKQAPDEYFIPLIHPVTKKKCPIPSRGWRNPPETMQQLLNSDRILFGNDETTQPRRKYLLEENMYENVSSLLYYGGSDDSLLSELGVFFDNPKPVHVSQKLISPICTSNDIILDFFAGSATTAQAVMQLNAKDNGNRKFIMVQFPEKCDEKSEAFKVGYKTIAEIGKERIRRAGKKIKDENAIIAPNLDIGFRVLKIDSSNMTDVYYAPDSIEQEDLLAAVDNIKPGRDNPEDLLFQVMLDWGVDLILPIRRETIRDKTVLFVDDNALIACFDIGITEDLVKELAAYKPHRVVFRDNGFASDAVKINVDQIFSQLSPTTEVKSI